jgi:DNA-binding NarL/FixJ family response regulator
MRTRETRLILLVDDHAAVRHGLALMLAEEGVGDSREAAGRGEALEAAGRERPDVALVDLSPGTEDALQLVAELCARNVPVLVCSMHEAPSYVRRALAAGARGYITKREAPRELARAVRDVLDGWMLISPFAAEGLGDIQSGRWPDGASSPNVRPTKASGEYT